MQRFDDTGTGCGGVDADEGETVRGNCGTVLDPPLLEVDSCARAGLVAVDEDMRLGPVVGHRQELDARLPARAERRGDG